MTVLDAEMTVRDAEAVVWGTRMVVQGREWRVWVDMRLQQEQRRRSQQPGGEWGPNRRWTGYQMSRNCEAAANLVENLVGKKLPRPVSKHPLVC